MYIQLIVSVAVAWIRALSFTCDQADMASSEVGLQNVLSTNTVHNIIITVALLLAAFIYTIICLKSVVVRKLQVAILARSPREMSQTDRIV